MGCGASGSASRRRGAERLAALLATLLLAGAAAGQEKVFREGALSERALVEALGGGAGAGEGELGAARGFRPVVPAPAAAPPGRAAILVTFVVGSAELTPRARAALDVLARALQSPQLASRAFEVEGHADPRGEESANLRLSQARAASVVDYLVTVHRLPAQRLTAVGLGSSRLLNRQDPTAPENRRVTVVAR